MSDCYQLTADRAPDGQLALGLAVTLDAPAPLATLAVGDRFLLESSGREGRLEVCGSGSVTVALWNADGRWTRTTWSPETLVRRMRA